MKNRMQRFPAKHSSAVTGSLLLTSAVFSVSVVMADWCLDYNIDHDGFTNSNKSWL